MQVFFFIYVIFVSEYAIMHSFLHKIYAVHKKFNFL